MCKCELCDYKDGKHYCYNCGIEIPAHVCCYTWGTCYKCAQQIEEGEKATQYKPTK